MAWEVDVEYIKDWLDEQEEDVRLDTIIALLELKEHGPALGMPLVDRIKGSSVHNLKELRPVTGPGSEIRVLFVFDSERRAVCLVAGDKSKGKRRSLRWSGWYKQNIPIAEGRYEAYLRKKAGHV